MSRHLREMRAAAAADSDRGSRIASAAVVGIEAVPVEVETNLSSGLPAVVMVGLPDAAVKEARDRVRAAIKACAGEWPNKRITLNLAPGDLRKEGPAFDLPVALGILVADGKLAPAHTAGVVAVGELALDGAVRPVRGILPIAIACRAAGKRLLLPAANAREAMVVEGLEVLPVSALDQAMRALQGRGAWADPPPLQLDFTDRAGKPLGDFHEVRGQSPAIRALTLAAAGGHNALLIGPPGTGKSMLSQRMPTILPPLSADEALDVTAVYSVCGLLPSGVGLVHER
ncbi:MAG: magnesium chelatase domain-containing protein, partial [Planctomycetota bacterium]